MTMSGSRWSARLAEGVVIVVSILLAFSLDAWWENRQRREEVDQMLALLDEEIEVNRTAMTRALHNHELIAVAADSAVEAANFYPFRMQAVLGVEQVSPQSSALRALEQSGLLREIQDPEFRVLIVEWSTRVLEFTDAEARSVARREGVRERIAEIGTLNDELGPGDPMWRDRRILNLLALRATDERDIVAAGQRVLGYLDRLQAKVEELQAGG